MDTSCYGPAFGIFQLRRAGAVCVFVAIIAMGIAIGVNVFITDPELGFTGAAVFTIITGLFALAATTRWVVMITCTLSVISCIWEVVAFSTDWVYSSLLRNMETCAGASSSSTSTFTSHVYYGSTSSINQELAFNCTKDSDFSGFDCSCSNGDELCLYFDGQSNCDVLFGKYTHMIQAATAFNVFTFIAVLSLSILTCCSLCCPGNLPGGNFDQRPVTYIVEVPTHGGVYAPGGVVVTAATAGAVPAKATTTSMGPPLASADYTMAANPSFAGAPEYSSSPSVPVTAVPINYTSNVTATKY